MIPTIKIFLDPITLNTQLNYSQLDDDVFIAIKLTLNAVSEELEYTEDGLIVPWHDFKSALVGISRILKREQVGLEFDEFSRELVNEYIDDKKAIKGRKQHNDFDEKSILTFLLEGGFQRKLTEAQKRDVIRLLRLKHGANFSVPGAGKTTTLLAVHTVLKQIGRVTNLFVISPINAFISWEDEIKEIFRDNQLTVFRLRSEHFWNFSEIQRLNPDVILVNYEKTRKDIRRIIPFFIRNSIHLVLDEAHRIKSGKNNLSFHQIVKLGDLARRRDILTGTPMPQNYRDLESQFDFLWTDQVLLDVDTNLDKEKQILFVNNAIKDLFVRTTKKELGLKNPIISYKYVELGPVQSELYHLFKSESARIFSSMDRKSLGYFRSIGRSVIRLLQAATNPMLLGTEDEYYDESEPIPEGTEVWELLSEFAKYEQSAKIEYLKQRVNVILSQNPTNKIVIWSYFVRNIQLLERLFSHYNPVSLYGSIPSGSDDDERNREGRIRKFHEDDSCRVMIANPQACGEGISLHKVCHFAIYLDRTFNAAHYLQSVDRIHRLGLPDTVATQIEILIARNTIDEVIIYRLNEKTEVMGKVLDDPYLITLAYDPADIPPEDNLGLDELDIRKIQEHIMSK